METMIQEVKKNKKQPVVKKVAKKSDNIFIQMVEKTAYDLYEKRSHEDGRDKEDWYRAEALVEDELCKRSLRRALSHHKV